MQEDVFGVKKLNRSLPLCLLMMRTDFGTKQAVATSMYMRPKSDRIALVLFVFLHGATSFIHRLFT